jgi:hypothetical protein
MLPTIEPRVRGRKRMGTRTRDSGGKSVRTNPSVGIWKCTFLLVTESMISASVGLGLPNSTYCTDATYIIL